VPFPSVYRTERCSYSGVLAACWGENHDNLVGKAGQSRPSVACALSGQAAWTGAAGPDSLSSLGTGSSVAKAATSG